MVGELVELGEPNDEFRGAIIKALSAMKPRRLPVSVLYAHALRVGICEHHPAFLLVWLDGEGKEKVKVPR